MGELTGGQIHVGQAIELPLPWGPVARGERIGTGPGAAIFLHEPGADLDAWGGLPALLSHELPLTVVSCDLPGHGLSDDPWELERLPEVVRALVGGEVREGRTPEVIPHPPTPLSHPDGRGGTKAPLPARRAGYPLGGGRDEGVQQDSAWFEGLTFLIAAGATATTALSLAGELTLSGLVCLSPAASEPEGMLPSSPHVPKLIVAGSRAENDLTVARRLSSLCGGWTVVSGFPVAARGTGPLASSHASHLVEALIAFLRDCTRRSRPVRMTPPVAW